MACRKIICDLPHLSRNGQKILAPLAVSPVRSYSARKDVESVTHTGQVFDEKDYRNVRFNNAKRYVNENWGIKLVDEIPPKECTERVVYCDGGDGPLGHPKVYINLDKPGAHICGYCGLRFVKKEGHHH
ncbi:NADH dehydrogenase [ubiquinone] iron-sulfur protein 6, mitochondrial [Stomoxys calcitrans]|uniref:NADH dehydrogenase [ubiquinone] iron-sulfur protein 6, mitochondrial n=1 Tax=Stomoxys calcitrans TaxID=35570 RepID=A0A1I8Q5X0_STOCA|nr:NADH dehydrogenase [ubiquinone] iron-sulfur protein 6, mitochondrial [Stomoxys calcitrans]